MVKSRDCTVLQYLHIMVKIKSVEYFRVKPRWLFVKITDEEGQFGWGEGTLEGHSLAVEGALDEIIPRIVGLEAEYAAVLRYVSLIRLG